MNFLTSLYVQARFYWMGVGIIAFFAVSYFIPILFPLAQIALLLLGVSFFLDLLVLFIGKNRIIASRSLADKFSNGDENTVTITVENRYPFKVFCRIIDEVPSQFQIRDFNLTVTLFSGEAREIDYSLRPTVRGEYHFGSLNVYLSSMLGLVSRRYRFDADVMVPTYPSFKQLRKFQLMNVHRNSSELGVKKIRKIGHSMEFEQIKEYVQGDDIRTINWKATAKKNQLMVNLHQDEKSQPIYSLIDMGRSMQMPFKGLSLLDYAINATLVISNIALKKHDRAGMLCFSKKVEHGVAAEHRNSQMQLILETLYNVDTRFSESDFSKLYTHVKQHITHRSLLLLYTNFETLDGLKRQLPYLKAMAKSHLLVVIFFKNTELDRMIRKKAVTVQDVYDKVIAEKFAFEKRLIVNELKKYGIFSILTAPEDLTVNTINQYLEIKARGLL